jgi:plasmid stabilization system protein ParE
MSRYTVELTEAALSAIAEQARYIAVDAQAPLNARRWLERIWDAVDSLERWPCRASLAEEDAYVEYEVRQLIVGRHLILFTVDDEHRTIWVIGFRHGHRRPRPGDLAADESEPRSDDPAP